MSGPPEPTRSDDDQLRALRSQLAVAMMRHLVALEQSLRLYDVSNSMITELAGEIAETAREFWRSTGEPLSLSVVQASWFAARRLVRMSYTDYRKAEQLRALWERLSVGEMIFPGELGVTGAQRFAKQLGQALSRAGAVELDAQPWGGVVVRPLDATLGSGHHEQREELLVRAYCGLVVLIRDLLQTLRSGARPPLLRIRRLLQLLADGSQDHEALLLGLGVRLGATGDGAAHLANVALHVLAIARRLRLPRQMLLELATAAILHDLPKLGLSAATVAAVEHPEGLGAVAQQQIREHWLRTLLRLGDGFTEELLPRLVVIYESQLEFAAALYPRTPELKLSLYSRVIAMANAMDLYARPRPGAAPAAPHQASAAAVAAYRPRVGDAVTAAAVDTTGWYPPGVAAVLESGEVGIVIRAAARKDPERPRLRLVRGPGGEPADGPELAPDPQRGRRLCWSMHPSRLGINPVPCLLRRT